MPTVTAQARLDSASSSSQKGNLIELAARLVLGELSLADMFFSQSSSVKQFA